MKFALVMLAVAPLCCSDICAVVYNSCVAQAGLIKAGGKLVTGSGKSASRVRSSASGCSCLSAGSRAARSYRNDDEDDNYYY